MADEVILLKDTAFALSVIAGTLSGAISEKAGMPDSVSVAFVLAIVFACAWFRKS